MSSSFSSSQHWPPHSPGRSASRNQPLIRTAQTKDLNALVDVLVDCFHSRKGLGAWTHPLFRLGIYEDLRQRLRAAAPNYVCLVAVEAWNSRTIEPEPDSLLAGTVEMTIRSSLPWQTPRHQYLYLSNLAVHPDYRRQGVAQQLLLACEQMALKWGFQELYLHVLENNHPAKRLYLKVGYQLHQVEADMATVLLQQPRRLFLRKCLISRTG